MQLLTQSQMLMVWVTPVKIVQMIWQKNETLTQNQSSDINTGVEESVNKPDDAKPIEEVKNEKNARESSQEAVNGSVPKKARRVCFQDDKLVSGYMDPPNPWNEGMSLLSNSTRLESRLSIKITVNSM